MRWTCTDGTGQRCPVAAEGWLCAPNGKRILAMCREHADRVIREYREKLGEEWSFAPSE